MKKKQKRGIGSRMLLLLAVGVLATSLMTSGTLAKYASEFRYGGLMKVAAFASSGTVNFDVALPAMTPGDPPKTVSFQVQNYQNSVISQVDTEYQVEIRTTGNLPLSFSLGGEVLSGEGDLVGDLDRALTPVNGVMAVSGGRMTGGEKTQHKYTLSVSWPETMAGDDYSHEIDMISVSVTAVQIQPQAVSEPEESP